MTLRVFGRKALMYMNKQDDLLTCLLFATPPSLLSSPVYTHFGVLSRGSTTRHMFSGCRAVFARAVSCSINGFSSCVGLFVCASVCIVAKHCTVFAGCELRLRWRFADARGGRLWCGDVAVW